jgi:pilus assembly protein CpaB
MMELNLDKMATETILQNVKVLAIDQTAKRPEDDKIKVGKTVTLAVSMQDAERLSLAAQMGDLLLALRGVGDNAKVVKQWPTISDARMTSVTGEIFKEYQKIKEETGVNKNSVRIYSGENMSVVPTR